MPRRRSFAPPKYRRFVPRDLAVVRIDGRDWYLGKYGSPESLAAYRRLLAENAFSVASPLPEAAAAPASPDPDDRTPPTVDEVLNAYRKFAREYYSAGGEPGKEFVEMGYAAAAVRQRFGRSVAAEFGPSKLKAVQRQLVDEGKLCRRFINRRINRIKRIFKWAVSEELVPPGVHRACRRCRPSSTGGRRHAKSRR